MNTLALKNQQLSLLKTYHTVIFAEQAMRYYKRIASESTMKYLLLAKDWLSDEINSNSWDKECKEAYRKLEDMLSNQLK